MFNQVDGRWRLLNNPKKLGLVIDVCNDENLRKNLTEDISILDKVTKNLEN